MPPPDKKGLTRPSMYVRIRPQATSGGHAQDGKAVAKTLEGWDDTSVTIGWTCAGNNDIGKPLERGQGQGYHWPERVLGPEVSQREVYEAIAPAAIDRVLGNTGEDGAPPRDPVNALVFAYGQTGTGKTHTTLGPDAALNGFAPAGGGVDERWGIFPRAVYDIYERLEASGRGFVLTISALEFYTGAANDLLAVNSPICLSSNHEPLGMCQIVLRSKEDIIPLIMRVRAARHVRHTRMNMAGGQGGDDEHGGSSRGHAMMILSVLQLSADATKMVRSTFSLVDLAGAERPDKTGEERVGSDAFMQEYIQLQAAQRNGKKMDFSVGAQAYMINYELYTLGDQANTAAEYYKNWKKGSPLFRTIPVMMTDAVRMMSQCFAGDAHVSVVVTLSQAPQCGWETWFSCRYGQNLSKLRAPLQSQRWIPVKKAIKEMLGVIGENVKALGNQINNKVSRFKRVATVTGNRINLMVIRELALRHEIPGVDPTSLEDFNLPEPATTGWVFDKSALQHKYELKNQWATEALESFLPMMDGMSDPLFVDEFQKLGIKAQRHFVDRHSNTMNIDPVNATWLRRCLPSGPIVVDTTQYPPCTNRRVEMYVYRPEDCTGATPALVYAHGGGGMYGKARQLDSHCARYAIEAKITVFNVEYRLAPEHKTPAGIYDATGIVLHLHDNAAKYGIDPSRIGIAGESGGGWIAAGCAMELVVRGRADCLKLCVPIAPMVSGIILKKPYHRVEGGVGVEVAWNNMVKFLSTPKTDPKYMWISKAGPAIFKAFPKTAIVTSEFDLCRRMAEDLGQNLDREGRLVEFLIHPGADHCWHSFMSLPNADIYWNDLKDILLSHLVY